MIGWVQQIGLEIGLFSIVKKENEEDRSGTYVLWVQLQGIL